MKGIFLSFKVGQNGVQIKIELIFSPRISTRMNQKDKSIHPVSFFV